LDLDVEFIGQVLRHLPGVAAGVGQAGRDGRPGAVLAGRGADADGAVGQVGVVCGPADDQVVAVGDGAVGQLHAGRRLVAPEPQLRLVAGRRGGRGDAEAVLADQAEAVFPLLGDVDAQRPGRRRLVAVALPVLAVARRPQLDAGDARRADVGDVVVQLDAA